MPIEIAPEELFETVDTPDASGFTSPAAQEPEPQHAYATPQLDPRIDQLQQTVNALLLRPQQPQVVYAQPQPQAEPQGGWQPHDFLTKEDATLLLTSADPAGQLNRVFNNVAQSLNQGWNAEIAKRDAILIGMHQRNEQHRFEQERSVRARDNQTTFYSLYPDMANYGPLVAYEAQQIAAESQRNPAAFVNATDHDVYSHLATRVQSRVEAIRGGNAAPSYTAPTPRRTFTERGSGARQGDDIADTNTKALREMTRFVGRGK